MNGLSRLYVCQSDKSRNTNQTRLHRTTGCLHLLPVCSSLLSPFLLFSLLISVAHVLWYPPPLLPLLTSCFLLFSPLLLFLFLSLCLLSRFHPLLSSSIRTEGLNRHLGQTWPSGCSHRCRKLICVCLVTPSH